jgi:hypothetical protein
MKVILEIFGSLGFNGVVQASKINKLHATAHFVRTCFSKYPLKPTISNTYDNYGYRKRFVIRQTKNILQDQGRYVGTSGLYSKYHNNVV